MCLFSQGAGKTTVVAPLLATVLADGARSVTQVVPGALLEMSRSVLREAFCAVVRKSVYTFTFSRQTQVTNALYGKLEVSTRILGRRMAPFPPFLIPDRVPLGFTQDPSTEVRPENDARRPHGDSRP